MQDLFPAGQAPLYTQRHILQLVSNTLNQQPFSFSSSSCAGNKITPRVLTEAMTKGGDVAKRVFEAMMDMQKIDVAKIEAAVSGKSV